MHTLDRGEDSKRKGVFVKHSATATTLCCVVTDGSGVGLLTLQSCLVMDPCLRLSCEAILELPYFQEEGALPWGREGERPGRRSDKGSRRRQAGVRIQRQRQTASLR